MRGFCCRSSTTADLRPTDVARTLRSEVRVASSRGSGRGGRLKRIRAAALAASLGLAGAGWAVASEQSLTLGGVAVVVWSNADASARQPVIVFSHGLHGCSTQSRYLVEAFAAAGCLVIAPDHRDAACHAGTAHFVDNSMAALRDLDSWSDATYRDRVDDIPNVAAALATDPRMKSRADLGHLGLAGHSRTGYTVMGLAGARPAWRMDDVRAMLALPPYASLLSDTRRWAESVFR